MSLEATANKKTHFSLEHFLARFLPAQEKEAILFWFFLPFFSLFLSVGLSFLQQGPFTKYLPFFAVGSTAVILRFRTYGLWASYFFLALCGLFFFPVLPFDTRLWQMGIIFTQALTLFILLLSVEECEAILKKGSQKADKLSNSVSLLEMQLSALATEKEEREDEFEKEIEKLKAEGELRKIDRAQALKQFSLIETELLHLIAQKDEFIEEVRCARKLAYENALALEQERSRCEEYKLYIEQLEEELKIKSALNLQNEDAQKQIEEGHKTLQRVQEELQLGQENYQKLLHQLSESKNYVQQLEEELILAEDQKKHFEKNLIDGQVDLAQTKQQLEFLAQESAALKEKIAQSQAFLITSQESCIALQQKNKNSLVEEKKDVELVVSEENRLEPQIDNQMIVRMQGEYRQLRSQFDQKSAVLNKTRRELFQTQNQLLALENDEKVRLEPFGYERSVYEKEILRLLEEIEKQEQEISNLEELVSRVLSQ